MNRKESVSLYISIPVCSFRKGYAREYLESEEVPPPSTVYGFLLSLIGEEDRYKYIGTELAYAIIKRPQLSVVMRTAWRIKDKKTPPGTGQNRRPDYQEILTGLEMAIWLNPGELADSIIQAENFLQRFNRYGGLSLGESRDLINDIIWNPTWQRETGQWLTWDPEGELPLPIWVDHVGSKNTVWRQFSLKEASLELPGLNDPRWIRINNDR
jgi:CRISPR-associated protein Cas5t